MVMKIEGETAVAYYHSESDTFQTGRPKKVDGDKVRLR